MNKDQANLSLGDRTPHPPTPKQTPTSAVFPSPVFETPNHNHFTNDSTGRTPRFAEEYSVFNSTPGDLRGTQHPFGDFDPTTIKYTHKRLLSAEGLAAQIASHVNHFSPNPDLPLPPVEPSRRLASSPNCLTVPKEYSADQDLPLSPDTSKSRQGSAKKPRRGTVTESEPVQTATPPPTDHRGKRKLAANLIMQNDQSFAQPDFTGASQHDLAALMAASGDMFGYPMSAPAAAPANFWDPSMSMDLDFNAQGHVFQAGPVSAHRHTGSFDWNNEIPLFQEPSAPMLQPGQETMQPVRRERALAPKPQMVDQMTPVTGTIISNTFAPMEDPFGIINPGDAVDPGLLFQRSMSAMDLTYPSMTGSGSAEAAIAESGSRSSMTSGGDLRRSSSVQDVRVGKAPERALASSPVKASRPALGRSMSENRGKRGPGRPALPKLAPAPRPVSQASNASSVDSNNRPMARPSGRSSPLKHQHRLSSLASIPEAIPQPQTWRSVRFTIDAHGRARAEATLAIGSSAGNENISPRRPSRDSSRRDDWDASDDGSSSDDEPIIIPSRNNSFNASFALPDPRKPVGSIFHSSKRSSSERSLSSHSNEDPGSHHDGESEAETVMNDPHEKVGDAASELRKLVEGRQKRSSHLGSVRGQRFLDTNVGGSRNDTISPSTLNDSNFVDRRDVRCICHNNRISEGDGFMVQCESCEMWLHGKCTNINRRTLPRVYICAFCANTPNMRGGRMRETGRGMANNAAASVASPLANKSFRNFR